MIQSYRNINILINGQGIIANNLELNNSLDISPVYHRTDEITSKTNANSGPKGNLRLSYYLTGQDVLNSYIYTTGAPISGFIGGYYFRSGYLTSYSFNAQPNSPVNIQSELVFFDPLTGVFNPQAQNRIVPQPLDFSNVSITYTSGFSSLDNIIGLDFAYSQEVTPIYKSQEIYAKQVTLGPKNINLKLTSDTNSGLFDKINGDPIKLNLNLQDRAGTNRLGFIIDGFIKNRQLSVENNSYLKTTYDISQYDVNNVTSISGYSPTSGFYYQTVSLSGINTDNIIALTFNNQVQNTINYLGTSRLTAQIPENSVSGKLYATYIDGSVNNIGLFNVLDYGIRISQLNPYTGSYYLTGVPNQIIITGSGFHAISRIGFGSGFAENWDINNTRTAIRVDIPSGAQYDFIRVISDLRQQTGTSPYKFVPIPQILRYDGTARNEMNITGLFAVNSSVNIIGRNMGGITGVDNAFGERFSTVYTSGENNFECSIPGGNVYNYALVFKLQSGLRISSANFTQDVKRFKPEIYISGVSGGLAGMLMTGRQFEISGRYFYHNILRESRTLGSGYYEVAIGDNRQVANMQIINPYKLRGTLPTGITEAGNVKVYLPDGINYVSNPNIYVDIHKNPVPGGNRYLSMTTGRSWDYIYYPETTFITGQNLEYVTGIKYQLSRVISNGGSDIYVDEWLNFSGWNYSNQKIFLPSTGINNVLISGITSGWGTYNNVKVDFTFFHRNGSGQLLSTATDVFNGEFVYFIGKPRETSRTYLYQHPLKFSGILDGGVFSNTVGTNGFISGSGIVQRRQALFNNPTHGVNLEYRFEGVSGLNFWATGSASSTTLRDGVATGNANTDLYGYGFNRVFRVAVDRFAAAPISSFHLNVGISGIRNSSSSSYLFNTGIYYFPYTIVATDGLTTGYSGVIYIQTGRYF